MHTVLTRGNAILAYTLSVLACLTFCCFISTVFLDYRTNVKINTVKTLVKNVPNYGASKELHDLGFITFDLTVSFSIACLLSEFQFIVIIDRLDWIVQLER
jgi:signal peptidase complex subunit 3